MSREWTLPQRAALVVLLATSVLLGVRSWQLGEENQRLLNRSAFDTETIAALHEQVEQLSEQVEVLQASSDALAEQVRALGGTPVQVTVTQDEPEERGGGSAPTTSTTQPRRDPPPTTPPTTSTTQRPCTTVPALGRCL